MQPTPTGTRLAWTLVGLLALANIAGYAFDLYSRWWWFDRVLHGTTILALTLWLILLVFAPTVQPALARSLRTVLLLACVGVAIGALWEVAEWAYDLAVPGDVIKGKHDTILDIIMDTVGALAAAILSVSLLRPGSPHASSRD